MSLSLVVVCVCMRAFAMNVRISVYGTCFTMVPSSDFSHPLAGEACHEYPN